MYSVGVPLPPAVRDLVRDFRPLLTGFERVRETRDTTLVAKRLDAADRREYLRAAREAKAALRGAPAFEARIADIGVFETPARGPGPLVYLAVESPGLERVHRQLAADLGAVEGIEGDLRALEDRVDGFESELGSLRESVAGIEDELSAVSETAQSVSAELEGIHDEVETLHEFRRSLAQISDIDD